MCACVCVRVCVCVCACLCVFVCVRVCVQWVSRHGFHHTLSGAPNEIGAAKETKRHKQQSLEAAMNRQLTLAKSSCWLGSVCTHYSVLTYSAFLAGMSAVEVDLVVAMSHKAFDREAREGSAGSAAHAQKP